MGIEIPFHLPPKPWTVECGRVNGVKSSILRWAEFIKFEHTVFAMPFGLAAMFLAAGGVPKGSVLFGVVVCLVGGRTAAMAFNRLADWSIDQKNPWILLIDRPIRQTIECHRRRPPAH